jgi:hypothetical protein
MFRCCAPYFSLFVLLSLGARAQNSVPQSTPESTSATANGYDDAAYRKLDQTLSFFRGRSVKEYAIDSAKGIDEASYVSIGGIEQWVTIRGEDRNNPVRTVCRCCSGR